MRNLTFLAPALLVLAAFAPAAVAADDELALFNDISATLKTPAQVQAKTPDEAQKIFVEKMDGVLAKIGDYRKRFPAGAHVAEVCLMQSDVLYFLAARIPNQEARLEGIPDAIKVAEAAAGNDEQKMLCRIGILRYNTAKQALAKTPEAAAPFEAEALKIAETMLVDFPKSPMLPAVLDYVAGAYERAGRDKDATAARERLIKEFPDSPLAKAAEKTLKQRALKGAVLEMSFKSVTGEEIDLKAYRGKVVLIDFWASWCGPCKASMPILVETEKKFRDQGFRVVGISLDNDRGAMDAYLAQMAMSWPQHFDGMAWQSPMVEKYFISGIPTMFLVDKAGKVREIGHIGPSLADTVKKLLDEPAPQ